MYAQRVWNEETRVHCWQVVQARPVGARVIVEAKPPNHIILSVVVLVAFCWVFGLIALIVGMQVCNCVHNTLCRSIYNQSHSICSSWSSSPLWLRQFPFLRIYPLVINE